MLVVKRLSAIDLLVTLGYKTAPKWEFVKVAGKLNELKTEITEDTPKPDRKGEKLLLEKILGCDSAICIKDADGNIYPERVKGGKKVKTKKTKKVKKNSKKTATKTVVKKTKKAKKAEKTIKVKTKKTKKNSGKTNKTKTNKTKTGGLGKDIYGSRIGSLCAKANTILSRTPKKMSQICEKAGIAGTVYVHLGNLIEKGIVENTPQGYKLTGKGQGLMSKKEK